MLFRSEGIGVLPWSPLARGRLCRAWEAPSSSDRVTHDRTAAMLYDSTRDADRRVVDVVGSVAKRLGTSRTQVALAWLLSRPGVTAPIIGSSKTAHLAEAVAALSVRLDAADCAELEGAYVPHAGSFYQEVPGGDQDR